MTLTILISNFTKELFMRIPYFNTLFQRCFRIVILFPSLIVLFALLFSSCFIAKPTYIFKEIVKDTIIHRNPDTDTQLKIQKNDLLSITISSLNPVEDATFNNITGSLSLGSKDGSANSGYTVNEEGNIYLHKLGTILVAGSTRKELKNKLEKELLPFLKDPIVTVNFGNHFITVIGEVGSAQIINMPAEKISLIDAIALSGNATPNANFKNLMVIRETATTKEFKRLNLENKSIFSSPWYYLQPKDILVIKPFEEKIIGEQRRISNQQLFATLFSGISLVLIILDRILRR